MKKATICGVLLSAALSVFGQNAWTAGEVNGFKFTALYTDEIIITRPEDVQFNLVLEYQEIDYFRQGLNEWLRLDSIYDSQLESFQKFFRTIHKQNISVTFIFVASGDNREMLIDVSGIIPYKFETFSCTKSDVQQMLKFIDECQKISKEKRASVRKLD